MLTSDSRVIEEIKTRAKLFVEDNLWNPLPADYLMIESAMMIGALMAGGHEVDKVTQTELELMAADLIECNCISMLVYSGIASQEKHPTVKTLCKILGVKSPGDFIAQRRREFEARRKKIGAYAY